MARIRSVHPDICQSETMAALDARLERTFVRLWTHCDDEGRCEDRPKIIKAAIYPEHDGQTPEIIDAELAMLAEDNLLIRYESGGKRYIQVRSWHKYQKPQKKRPSKYPPPIGWNPEDDEPSTGEVRDKDDSPPASRPDGYGPVVGEGDGGVEGDGERRGSGSSLDSPPPLQSGNGASSNGGGVDFDAAYRTLHAEFPMEDIGAAMQLLRLRISAGEKISSPVLWASAVCRNLAEKRKAAARADEPKRVSVDGAEMVFAEGRWFEADEWERRVQEVLS